MKFFNREYKIENKMPETKKNREIFKSMNDQQQAQQETRKKEELSKVFSVASMPQMK